MSGICKGVLYVVFILIVLAASCHLETVKQIKVQADPDIQLSIADQSVVFADLFEAMLVHAPSGTEVYRGENSGIPSVFIPPIYTEFIDLKGMFANPKSLIEFPQAFISIFGEPNDFSLSLYADVPDFSFLIGSAEPIPISMPIDNSTGEKVFCTGPQGADIGCIDVCFAGFSSGKLYVELTHLHGDDFDAAAEILDARLLHGDSSSMESSGLPVTLKGNNPGVLVFDLAGVMLTKPVLLKITGKSEAAEDSLSSMELKAHSFFSDDTALCCLSSTSAQYIYLPHLSYPIDFQLESNGISYAAVSQGTLELAVTIPDAWKMSLNEEKSSIALFHNGEPAAYAQINGNYAVIQLDDLILDSSYTLSADFVLAPMDEHHQGSIDYREPVHVDYSVNIDNLSRAVLHPDSIESRLQAELLESAGGFLRTLYKGFLAVRSWITGSQGLLISPKRIVCNTSTLLVTLKNDSPVDLEFIFISERLFPEPQSITVPRKSHRTQFMDMNTEIDLAMFSNIPIYITVKPDGSSDNMLELNDIPSGVFAASVTARPFMRMDSLEIGEFSETSRKSFDDTPLLSFISTYSNLFPEEINFSGVEGKMHVVGLSEMDGTVILLAKYNNTVIELLGSLRHRRMHNFRRFQNYIGVPLAQTMKLNPGALDAIINSRATEIEFAYQIQADHLVSVSPFFYSTGVSVSVPLVLNIDPGKTASLDVVLNRSEEALSGNEDFLKRSNTNGLTNQMLDQIGHAAFHFDIENTLGIQPILEVSHGDDQEFFLRKVVDSSGSILLTDKQIKYIGRTYPFDPKLRLILEHKEGGHVLNPEGSLRIHITMHLGMDFSYMIPLRTLEYR